MPAHSHVAHVVVAFPYSIIRHGYGGTLVHHAFAANTDCDIRRSHPSGRLRLYHISMPPSPIPSYALSSTMVPEFTMATSPSPTPSFTAPMPMSLQWHCDDVFYRGMDGIRASTTQLQAVVCCLLAHRQGQRQVVPATLRQLTERKAIAGASACMVSAVVRLQAAARGLLVRQRLQEVRQQMLEAAWWRSTSAHEGATSPCRTAIGKREHGAYPAGDELQLYGSGGREGSPPCHRQGRTS